MRMALDAVQIGIVVVVSCLMKVFLEFIPDQLSLIKFSVTISSHISALPLSPDLDFRQT